MKNVYSIKCTQLTPTHEEETIGYEDTLEKFESVTSEEWFIIRGVSRLFETIVLGGLSLYAISEMARYLGIEVDYPALFSQISEAIQNLLTFINTHLPG